MKKLFTFIVVLVHFCLNVNAQTIAAGSSNTTSGSGWQIYSNSKYGFSFQYPNTWTKYGKESDAINRNGSVMSILVNFIDTVSHSTFLIEYHLAPAGAKLYKYAKAQFDSSHGAFATDAKQIDVAGNKAIEAFSTMTKDIKGNIFNPPFKIISIQFLDKQQTGEFELHFKTSLPADSETAKFMNVISTFSFIN